MLRSEPEAIAIPLLGLNGAVLALVVGTVANMSASLWMVRSRFSFKFPFSSLFKLLLSQALAVCVAYPLNWFVDSKWRLFVVVPAFVFSFLLFTLILKVWYSRDFDLLLGQSVDADANATSKARILRWCQRNFAAA